MARKSLTTVVLATIFASVGAPAAHAERPLSWEARDAIKRKCEHLGSAMHNARPLRTELGMTREEVQSELSKTDVPSFNAQDKRDFAKLVAYTIFHDQPINDAVFRSTANAVVYGCIKTSTDELERVARRK